MPAGISPEKVDLANRRPDLDHFRSNCAAKLNS
jgi:hypothetical protein